MNKKAVLLILSILLLAGLVFGAYSIEKSARSETIDKVGTAEHGISKVKEIEYDGQKARLRRQLETFLLIGIDSADELPYYSEKDLIPFFNYDQADFLVLLVLDNAAKTANFVQINRDTMMDVPWLGVTGKVGGTHYEQIALSHNSGSGLKDSCVNTCNAVSKLLFGTPVDHYVKLTMGAVPLLTDIVGGVTVNIEDDLSSIAPEMIKGAKVKLDGEQALAFVRARMGVGDGTNISRMRRQREFLHSFTSQAKLQFANNAELIFESVQDLDKFMLTDMSSEMLASVGERLTSYTNASIYTPTGDNRIVDGHYQFNVDEAALWEEMKKIIA